MKHKRQARLGDRYKYVTVPSVGTGTITKIEGNTMWMTWDKWVPAGKMCDIEYPTRYCWNGDFKFVGSAKKITVLL